MNYYEAPMTRRQKVVYLALCYGLALLIAGLAAASIGTLCTEDYEIAAQIANAAAKVAR